MVSSLVNGGRPDSAMERVRAESATSLGVTMPNLRAHPPAWHLLDDSLRGAFHFLATSSLPSPSSEAPQLLNILDLANDPQGRRLTVVLDLDETLSHCRLERLESPQPDFCVRFEESKATGFVYVRPFARLFLEVAAQLFEVIVFTASSQSYADQVIDQLDPENRCISGRLYRQHCSESGGCYLKDMTRLGRPLERVALVDNSPVSLALCPDNGILVSSWTAEQNDDRELLELLLILQRCVQEVSVPDFLSQRYGRSRGNANGSCRW
eukprot:TRINITY_DN23330_c0_g1_i1.p1 TRINITY_DN23330_c0_g1~~TRINITY_DN23330_c0_g1_i1.p1  ORF type:complete len:274 (-),score=39.60 TRINITY_DN23330_c0_g1_i1:111-911(-)